MLHIISVLKNNNNDVFFRLEEIIKLKLKMAMQFIYYIQVR